MFDKTCIFSPSKVKQLLYIKVEHVSGGFHGHQFKDLLSGYLISELLNAHWLSESFEMLNFLGLHSDDSKGEMKDVQFDEIHTIEGPIYHGIPINELEKFFRPFTQNRENSKVLLLLKNAVRFYPYQLLSADSAHPLFNKMLLKLKSCYDNARDFHPIAEVEKARFEVAIHISRGIDWMDETNHRSPHTLRFMFPILYFENLIQQIRKKIPNAHFSIYTEKLNSEAVVNAFINYGDVKVQVGSDRKEVNQAYIEWAFHQLVMSDLLVTCNSAFSWAAAHFRGKKPSIYHPHTHIKNYPKPTFIPSRKDGSFNTDLLLG